MPSRQCVHICGGGGMRVRFEVDGRPFVMDVRRRRGATRASLTFSHTTATNEQWKNRVMPDPPPPTW